MIGQSILNQITSKKGQIRQFGVTKIGLFGSIARGEESKESDIDILVEFDPSKKTFRNFIGIANYMEKLTGRPVDIVTPQSLSPHIKPHVLKEVRYVEIDS